MKLHLTEESIRAKICTMPMCEDFAAKGNRWCKFHIKEAEEEFSKPIPK